MRLFKGILAGIVVAFFMLFVLQNSDVLLGDVTFQLSLFNLKYKTIPFPLGGYFIAFFLAGYLLAFLITFSERMRVIREKRRIRLETKVLEKREKKEKESESSSGTVSVTTVRKFHG